MQQQSYKGGTIIPVLNEETETNSRAVWLALPVTLRVTSVHTCSQHPTQGLSLA